MIVMKAQCFGTVLFQLVCTLSLKFHFSPLHCPHQLSQTVLLVALWQWSQCKTAGMKLGITSCLLRKLHLIIYLYPPFYFPVAKGTTLGSETRLEVCVCTREWYLFSLFLFFLFTIVVSFYLGEWLLSEHAQFVSVPVEMNSTAINTLFHVFQTWMRILTSLGRLEQ